MNIPSGGSLNVELTTEQRAYGFTTLTSSPSPKLWERAMLLWCQRSQVITGKLRQMERLVIKP